MNNIENRLVELNQALLKLSADRNKMPDEKMLDRAVQVLSGQNIDTGLGNETIIINQQKEKGNCPPGESGYSGYSGYSGFSGESGYSGYSGETGQSGDCQSCTVNTILVDDTYYANTEDCYIGVNSENATTIYLPKNPNDGKIIIIKAEMQPPIGNRKVTVTTDDGSLIDGSFEYVIQNSYETITVLYRNNEWKIIAYFS